MMHVELDMGNGIALLEPNGALEQADFEKASAQIDPAIEQLGRLAGLIIHVEKFPGWDSFGALVSHLKFVRSHHREIDRIAFVTDSAIGNLAEKVGSHFVAAEIERFDFKSLETARKWILNGE